MQRRDHPLPCASIGTQRTLTSFHYGTPGVGQKVYVQASLHADELPGMLVAHHLRQRLAVLDAQQALRGEVIVVPVANPIGLSQRLLHSVQGRFDLPTGENFNRHYPALLDAVWALVEPQLDGDEAANGQRIRAALRAAIAELSTDTELAAWRAALLALACDADVVLDLHCDTEAVLHLYTGTPLWPACEPLARLLGSQATLLATESGDHPFDEACSQIWWELADKVAHSAKPDRPVPLGCLSVTVELRGSTDVDHALAERDADALIEFLRHRGVVADMPPSPLPELLAEATPLAGSQNVTAPTSGVIAWLRVPGDRVAQGEVVADLVDPVSGQVTPLTSPTDGVLYARDTPRFVTAGARVAKVAGREAVRTGKLLGD